MLTIAKQTRAKCKNIKISKVKALNFSVLSHGSRNQMYLLYLLQVYLMSFSFLKNTTFANNGKNTLNISTLKPFFFKVCLFVSFYHNKIHPVTTIKQLQLIRLIRTINKTKQHRAIFLRTKQQQLQKKKKKKDMKLLVAAPFPFYFERSINQLYDQ